MRLALCMAVAAGGALGALARYYLAAWIMGRIGGFFPYGTLTVNLAGCFLIGFLYPVGGSLPAPWRVFLTGGFLGAFTTFSTFSLETMELLAGEQPVMGVVYLGVSFGLGLLAVWTGMKVGNLILLS